MWEEKAPYDWWKVEKHFGCFFSACCPFSGSLIRCGNTRLRWRRLFWTLSGWTVLQLSGNPGNPKQQAHTGTNNIIELFIHYIAAHMTTSGLHAHVSHVKHWQLFLMKLKQAWLVSRTLMLSSCPLCVLLHHVGLLNWRSEKCLQLCINSPESASSGFQGKTNHHHHGVSAFLHIRVSFMSDSFVCVAPCSWCWSMSTARGASGWALQRKWTRWSLTSAAVCTGSARQAYRCRYHTASSRWHC